jgi:hypothetical protein
MAMYVFHLFRADGGSTAFEAHELEGEAEVVAQANRLLEDHPSSVRVAVWEDERQVLEWPRRKA